MPPPDEEMRIEAHFEESKIGLVFPSQEALGGFFKEALAHQAFLLRLDQKPEPFVAFAFSAQVANGTSLNFQAVPVQIFNQEGAFETAFQFTDWTAALDHQLESMVQPSRKDGLADKPQPVIVDTVENLGSSPVFRIKEMDAPQRIQLALKADRGERVILCHDTMAPVLVNLLSNPQLDSENVLTIAKSPYASPDILQRVASDRRWLASADIRIALVRNPKTPTPIAQRLLDTLPMNELRTLAKVGNSKEDLRRMALALVMKSQSSR